MLCFSGLVLGALVFTMAVCRTDDECPPLPDDFEFGVGIPPLPEDIPHGCSDYEVLVARGTSEPNFHEGGKFGVIVGDPIVSNLTDVLSGVQGYPVQYPANSSFVENMNIGADDIVARIESQAEKCPDQTFALVGYSQGAGVVHEAAVRIPGNLINKVKSISVFGDPSSGENQGGIWPSSWPYGLESKVRHVCAEGDPICDASQDCFYEHLTYIRPEYIDPAVTFIADNFVNT